MLFYYYILIIVYGDEEGIIGQINSILDKNRKFSTLTYDALKMMDTNKLCEWLEHFNFDSASAAFKKEKINGEMLLQIDDATIRGFGVAYGDVFNLRKEINKKLPQLPPNWVKAKDPKTGKAFYANITDMKIQWELPTK